MTTFFFAIKELSGVLCLFPILVSYAYLYIFTYLCVNVCACMQMSREANWEHRVTQELKLQVVLSHLCGFWELNSGTLHQVLVLLATGRLFDHLTAFGGTDLSWLIRVFLTFVIFRGAESPLGRVCPQTLPWAGEGGAQSKERRPDPSTHRGLESGHWPGHWLFRCSRGIHCWLVG